MIIKMMYLYLVLTLTSRTFHVVHKYNGRWQQIIKFKPKLGLMRLMKFHNDY